MKKTKLFLEAVVIIAVVLSLILPSSAVVTNKETNDIKPFDGSTQIDIQGFKAVKLPENIRAGENIPVSGVEDDILPSICKDLDGHTVITYTNQPSFSEGHMGISWSDTPDDPMSWDGWIISITEDDMFFDTALIQGPEPDDYKDLMGVYMQMGEEFSGYYTIEDITSDPAEWLFYNWQGGAPEPEYACISDMTFYQDLNYPDMWGPFNFYIYREIYDIYDITSCPICFHTDIRGGTGGVGYFDAQSEELTAPASDPDMVDLGDRFHTIIQYNNETTGEHIVWKKIVPAEQPDYEYTPYQDTIATGENPSIAAFDDGKGGNVAVAYVDGSDVKCIYSFDDGENWDTSTIGLGGYPDIYAIGDIFYCAYIYSGDLYLSTSDDGGEIWSTPEQINDEPGTVVAEENAVDLYSGGVVWVDERNADLDIYYASFEIGDPPEAPTITGETNGDAGTPYPYTFVAEDPDLDDIAEFIVNWDDGNEETIEGPFGSGESTTVNHTFAVGGTFEITARAKDVNGLIGPKGSLTVIMPRSRTIDLPILKFLQNYPILFKIVQHLLGL
ncbi:MAG: PKD domain-containing protein [Thermoplasmatales archaeon]|nr:PKD domain-containing protein [Thermoplasmatales archaeon]